MARETRKLERAARKTDGESGKDKRRALAQPVARPNAELPDPFGPEQRKALFYRLGLPVLGVWFLCGLIASVSQSETVRTVVIAVPTIVTVGVVALLLWTASQAKKARGVAGILKSVDTDDDRKAAIEQLGSQFKKGDPAAVFAKAQLLLQEDPERALAELETIDLEKVMAPVADEARGQRAMIHLLRGEVSRARQLVDGIGLDRHQEPRARAMLGAVVAEAWARSGNAKKAIDTLALFDAEDPTFADVRPQLYRAQAFAAVQVNDTKLMRKALRKLLDMDVRLLGSFMGKKTHPLLAKEARKIIEQSGLVPRKMQVQRG